MNEKTKRRRSSTAIDSRHPGAEFKEMQAKQQRGAGSGCGAIVRESEANSRRPGKPERDRLLYLETSEQLDKGKLSLFQGSSTQAERGGIKKRRIPGGVDRKESAIEELDEDVRISFLGRAN